MATGTDEIAITVDTLVEGVTDVTIGVDTLHTFVVSGEEVGIIGTLKGFLSIKHAEAFVFGAMDGNREGLKQAFLDTHEVVPFQGSLVD